MIQITVGCDEEGCQFAISTAFDNGEENFYGLLSSLEDNGWVVTEPERAKLFKVGLQQAVKLRCPVHVLLAKALQKPSLVSA